MSKPIPLGFTQQQWETIVGDLSNNTSTINDYRKVLNLLQKYKDGSYQITTLTKPQAIEYFNYLDEKEESGALSKNTVHRYKATLRSLGSRIENHPEVFPNYKNPFSRLMKNEKRNRTTYQEKAFVDPSVIKYIRSHLSELTHEEELLIHFLIDVGFSPKQIEEIKVCDFKQNEDQLTLSMHPTQFTERKDDTLMHDVSLPLEEIRKSVNGNTTWKYYSSFTFFSSFTETLKKNIPSLGMNEDTRPFFLTPRHMKYSYRVIHHMVTAILEKLNLDKTITPYQLSIYGMVHSYLLDEYLRQHALLDQEIAKEISPIKKQSLQEEVKKVESIFIPLAKESWIGNWDQTYPLPMLLQINAIKKQLGEDTLLKIVGLK